MNKRVVVIPAHNEQDTIGSLVVKACDHADAVIVANDNSLDETKRVALKCGAIVVDVPRERRGMVGVYRYGLLHAINTFGVTAWICEMDAGGSHNPEELPLFWNALARGCDIALGCRFKMDGASYTGHWKRKLLSVGGTMLTNAIHGTKFRDATSGFIAYEGSALYRLLKSGYKAQGHYYQTELRLNARRLNLTCLDVPITFKSTNSTLNWRSVVESLRLVAK